jgi:outer membrane protein OmpA-like peptidoglycan-associated protein
MRIATLILASALTAGMASAASADGWYFSAGTGVNYVPDLKATDNKAGANPTKMKTDIGMVIDGAIGYGFDGLPIRVEGEFGWRDNSADTVSTPALGSHPGTGDFQPLSFMANVYYDFHTGSAFTPYVGAGVGAVDLSVNSLSESGRTLIDNSATGLGYQGIVGASYKVNDALSLRADYRYLATTEVDLPNSAAVGTGTAKLAYESHAVLIGFIYRFNAPPPPMPAQAAAAAAPAPAPPAPAPAPAAAPAMAPAVHQFQVFFDFDKSDITPDARQIIEQAAAAAKSQGTARIDLTGHTDTVGTVAYNQKLSERRALAVKKALVELGIAADEITTVGKGKTDLLVPTPDGVREPKNRRVEIVLP